MKRKRGDVKHLGSRSRNGGLGLLFVLRRLVVPAQAKHVVLGRVQRLCVIPGARNECRFIFRLPAANGRKHRSPNLQERLVVALHGGAQLLLLEVDLDQFVRLDDIDHSHLLIIDLSAGNDPTKNENSQHMKTSTTMVHTRRIPTK